MAVLQYVGARYVPKLFNDGQGGMEWQANTYYEPLTIVTYNNISYTSRGPVSANVGNPAENGEHWAETGNYNAYLGNLQEAINALKVGNYAVPEQYGAKGDGIADDTEAIKKWLNSNNFFLYLPANKYICTKEIVTSESHYIYGPGEIHFSCTAPVSNIRFLHFTRAKYVHLSGIKVSAEGLIADYFNGADGILCSISYCERVSVQNVDMRLTRAAYSIKCTPLWITNTSYPVYVRDSVFSAMGGGNRGGALWFYGVDAPVYVDNCLCETQSLDEIVASWGAANSTLYMTATSLKAHGHCNNMVSGFTNGSNYIRGCVFANDDDQFVDFVVKAGGGYTRIEDCEIMLYAKIKSFVLGGSSGRIEMLNSRVTIEVTDTSNSGIFDGNAAVMTATGCTFIEQGTHKMTFVVMNTDINSALIGNTFYLTNSGYRVYGQSHNGFVFLGNKVLGTCSISAYQMPSTAQIYDNLYLVETDKAFRNKNAVLNNAVHAVMKYNVDVEASLSIDMPTTLNYIEVNGIIVMRSVQSAKMSLYIFGKTQNGMKFTSIHDDIGLSIAYTGGKIVITPTSSDQITANIYYYDNIPFTN